MFLQPRTLARVQPLASTMFILSKAKWILQEALPRFLDRRAAFLIAPQRWVFTQQPVLHIKGLEHICHCSRFSIVSILVTSTFCFNKQQLHNLKMPHSTTLKSRSFDQIFLWSFLILANQVIVTEAFLGVQKVANPHRSSTSSTSSALTTQYGTAASSSHCYDEICDGATATTYCF